MGIELDESGLSIALVLENALHRFALEGMIRVFDRASTIQSLNSRPADGQRFDLVLTAAAELGNDGTPELVQALCADGARLLLLLVDGPEPIDPQALARCEAQGFLAWSEVEPETLREAMSDALAGKFYVSGMLARKLLVRASMPPPAPSPQPAGAEGAALSARELAVLELVAQGLSNKQVSRQLQISEHGVKRHVGNVLTKLNCPNRTLAVVRALEDGLLAV
ncbi:response regulator transcription factor [Kitasatospora sp. NBC_00240]|uniref:response regulator transcription factor n=1 Tax=Kitasatospora sp. NBC_00240 TaxID=2903567 RepID=UPI00225867B9|nr:response regulator transcription factor [Kitasatospora sp. NBC_00240]MCX5213244.1 response regulator transcription factor [Kitasatospora sp. NBC_00240]